jgi:hypothetical protein
MIGKYSRYCCTPTVLRPPADPYCCVRMSEGSRSTIAAHVTLPESIRQRQQLCAPYILTQPSTQPCWGQTNPERVRTTLDAPVLVRTRPASETTAYLGELTLNQANSVINPDTRFEQYFRPLPPPLECPERIPNPVVAPPCLDPPQVFESSVPTD